MPKTKSDPKIVAYTEDGIPLPALSYSDNPDHVLAQRRSDENHSRDVEIYMVLADGLGLHEACAKRNCRRLKKCSGAKRATAGRCMGLYDGFPPCFEHFHQPVAEIVREGLKEQK